MRSQEAEVPPQKAAQTAQYLSLLKKIKIKRAVLFLISAFKMTSSLHPWVWHADNSKFKEPLACSVYNTISHCPWQQKHNLSFSLLLFCCWRPWLEFWKDNCLGFMGKTLNCGIEYKQTTKKKFSLLEQNHTRAVIFHSKSNIWSNLVMSRESWKIYSSLDQGAVWGSFLCDQSEGESDSPKPGLGLVVWKRSLNIIQDSTGWGSCQNKRIKYRPERKFALKLLWMCSNICLLSLSRKSLQVIRAEWRRRKRMTITAVWKVTLKVPLYLETGTTQHEFCQLSLVKQSAGCIKQYSYLLQSTPQFVSAVITTLKKSLLIHLSALVPLLQQMRVRCCAEEGLTPAHPALLGRWDCVCVMHTHGEEV